MTVTTRAAGSLNIFSCTISNDFLLFPVLFFVLGLWYSTLVETCSCSQVLIVICTRRYHQHRTQTYCIFVTVWLKIDWNRLSVLLRRIAETICEILFWKICILKLNISDTCLNSVTLCSQTIGLVKGPADCHHLLYNHNAQLNHCLMCLDAWLDCALYMSWVIPRWSSSTAGCKHSNHLKKLLLCQGESAKKHTMTDQLILLSRALCCF